MSDFEPDPEERLPIDPWTIAVGVVRRRRFLAIFIAGSVVVALAAAFLFGGPVFRAQSVLMYHPDSEGRGNDPTLTIQTQANMVLLDTNLEETRSRLDIPVSLKQLESACEVRTQPNTALLMIDVSWNSPDIAARIANTLRDVFVANQQTVRHTGATLEVQDLRARIDQLRQRIKETNARLDEFSASSGLVDLDKETQNYLTELTSTELLYSQARAERQSVEMQLRSAGGILRRAQDASPADQPIGELNTRASRLRDAIHEDQTVRASQAELQGAKVNLDRATQLFQEGLLPKSELDKAQAAYQTEKERAVDTEQVKAWRADMARLDRGIIPPDGATGTSRDTQQKLAQLQLDRIAAEQKEKTLGEAVERLRQKIGSLPKLQRDYLTYTRESESNEAELKQLVDRLGRAERAQMAKSSEFVRIADATPPVFPVRSRRTIIFLGISAFGSLLALGFVLTAEALNRTVRSAGEAAIKVPLPLLGIVPRQTGYRGKPAPDERVPEPFRALALHVRRTVSKKGARILFFSARTGEGVSTVVDYLAESLRHEHLSVVVRSAQAGLARAAQAGPVLDSDSHVNDIVLIDGPPILESIDSEVLAPLCDAAILVIASGVTPAGDIAEAVARVRATRVPMPGAVLNSVNPAYL